MTQHSPNQQTGRKYGGSSSFTETRTPSKAPQQDEPIEEFLGASPHDDGGEATPDDVRELTDDDVRNGLQSGGNRGSV